MARVTPVQTNFNAGEISRRLHARIDLNIYSIGLAECTGWIPLPEGGLDAMPGTIMVAPAAGPCRLVPFAVNRTQGYIVEMSAAKARFYTNDARIEAGGGPVELALPYSLSQIEALSWSQSFDVLYLYHGAHPTQELVRIDADQFELHDYAFENGPFEPRNKDESLIVWASNVAGDVTLTSNADLFEAGDVGGLFQIEADDFGAIAMWQPGITVTNGQLLTWGEAVYRVTGGSNRTGTVAPIHREGVEWDGIGQGTDVNGTNAGGVRLEYVHDRFGILRITGFTSATVVSATVLRRLPFTTVTTGGGGNFTWNGGYYNDTWEDYVPDYSGLPESGYAFGTWRWRFGAFSNRRGFPTAGCIWNERKVLAKGSTLYLSVVGDLQDHATLNELGEISNDMAMALTIEDPNGIVGLIGRDRLMIVTGDGMFALGPSSAAAGVGPTNFRVDRQNDEGGTAAMPVELDGRSLYIGKSRRRVIEADYNDRGDRQQPLDLTRYARHLGAPRFKTIVSTKDPNRLIWALRADGSLAVACHVPEEQVLGWVTRQMAEGVAARSIAPCADPTGELDQLWMAVEYSGSWWVVRQAQFRQEGDAHDPAMTDLAAEYEGPVVSNFGPVPWLAGKQVHVEADGAAIYPVQVDGAGMFSLTTPAARVAAGLSFPARFTTLPAEAGGDNGPAMGKMKRVSRFMLNVLQARGLRCRMVNGTWRDFEQLVSDSLTDSGFAPDTGLLIREDTGTNDRFAQAQVERVAPVAATVRAVQVTVAVQDK